MPNIFHPSNFDPAQVAPNNVMIFDDSGYLDTGGGYANTSTPIPLLQANLDQWVESDFANAGFSHVVWDVDTQFADATYFYAVNSAVSNSQGVTYYIDHGIQGTSGSDVVIDISGNNVVNTGAGDDLILLGSGNNFVDAGRGNDVVVLGVGDDVVKLGQGDDWLWAGGGNDIVRAGRGNDTVRGREGEDTLAGGKGEDWLLGGADDDRLNGGQDDDRLEGGIGNDTMIGGSGADVFVFEGGTGRDVVRDYTDGVDRIEIDMASTGLSGFGDLGLTQVGNRVEVDLGNGDEIVLRGVQVSDLGASDFDFV